MNRYTSNILNLLLFQELNCITVITYKKSFYIFLSVITDKNINNNKSFYFIANIIFLEYNDINAKY